MSKLDHKPRRQRGYALIFVVVLTGALAAVTGTVAAVSLVEARASAQNINSVRAYALAFSGLQRAMAAINKTDTDVIEAMDGRDMTTGVIGSNPVSIICGNASEVCLGPVKAPPCDAVVNSPVFNNWSQVSAADPGGTGTSYQFGLGGYRIFLMQDYAEPVDPNDPCAVAAGVSAGCASGSDCMDNNSYVLIRVYGWWGHGAQQADAMIESTYMAVVPPTNDFPAGFSGCFENANMTVWHRNYQGPGAPLFSFRMDAPGKPPYAFEYDPFRWSGMGEVYNGTALNPNYRFSGPYQLNVIDTSVVLATAHAASQQPIGLSDFTQGIGYDGSFVGTGAAPNGSSDITRYKLPTIGIHDIASTSAGWEQDEQLLANYDDSDDAISGASDYAAGTYGCCNRKRGGTTFNANPAEMVGGCVTGTETQATGASWSTESTRQSGIAWNMIQTVVRNCSGSGQQANCNANYDEFENIAKCLILPDTVDRPMGTDSDFRDCDTDGTCDDHNDAPDSANDVTWYPGGYPRLKVGSLSVIGTSANPNVAAGDLPTVEALARAGLCLKHDYIAGSPTGATQVYVKYCDPVTKLDPLGYNCLTDAEAWAGNQCPGDPSSPVSKTPSKYWSQRGTVPDLYSGALATALTNATTIPDPDAVESYVESQVSWGHFTTCADECVFKHDGSSRHGAGDPWRSVCINLDPYHVHQYGRTDNASLQVGEFLPPTWVHGERGSIHMITRLDLTDDGPLGACNRYYDDPNNPSIEVSREAGTCLTGGDDNMAPLQTHDFDNQLGQHPRVGRPAIFSRPPPDNAPTYRYRHWLPSNKLDTSFCTRTGAGANPIWELLDVAYCTDYTDLSNSMPARPWGVGAAPASITPGAYPNLTFGDATCTYDSTPVGGAEAGWYVSDCPDGQAERVMIRNISNGVLCGCGILGINAPTLCTPSQGGGNITITRESIVAWRGLVVWGSKDSSTLMEFRQTAGGEHLSWYVDGAMIGVTVSATPTTFKLWEEVGETAIPGSYPYESNVNYYVRLNPEAIQDAFAGIKVPFRAFRQLY